MSLPRRKALSIAPHGRMRLVLAAAVAVVCTVVLARAVSARAEDRPAGTGDAAAPGTGRSSAEPAASSAGPGHAAPATAETDSKAEDDRDEDDDAHEANDGDDADDADAGDDTDDADADDRDDADDADADDAGHGDGELDVNVSGGNGPTSTQPPRAKRPALSEDIAREQKPGAEETRPPAKDRDVKAAESALERGFTTFARDAWITSRVKLNLVADGHTPGLDINVDTIDGVVTLFGIVPSDGARASAESDASAVAGVRRVRNLIQVVPDEAQAEVHLQDQQILGHLRRGLEPYPDMRGVFIDVKNCVVRLTGTVSPGRSHDEAMDVVRSAPGVCAVEDDLRFSL